MYTATQIAIIFAKKAIAESKYLTQMKLQKLVYFAHGYFMAKNDGQPLIKDDVQAWEFGPVMPVIYHAFKFYGSNPIIDLDLVSEGDQITLSKSAQEAVDFTWANLKEINASRLSAWTHKEGSPWKKFYENGVRDVLIPNSEINSYFKEFLATAQ